VEVGGKKKGKIIGVLIGVEKKKQKIGGED